MKKITIIRHAQSKFNAGEYTTDDELRNCELSELGKQQAKNLNHEFDLLVLSPLKRAIETYAHSNIKTKNVIICDLFREQKEEGQLNYLDFEEINPESIEDIKQRVLEAKDYLKMLSSNNIGIISHAVFIYYFLWACDQPARIIGNTESIVLEI